MKNRLYSVLLLLVFASCGNFLEEYSQNASYVTGVDDLDELLLGEVYIATKAEAVRQLDVMPDAEPLSFLHVLADESRERVKMTTSVSRQACPFEILGGMFIWRENPFTYYDGTEWTDSYWATFYKRISVVNSILEEADKLTLETDAERLKLNRVLGECYYLRAWNYFMLANLYGMAYDKRSADRDGSVTLKLNAKIEDTKFSRHSAGEVYRQMVADLKSAAELLENGEALASKRHVTAAAAHALLSRVYLYMEEYESAVKEADLVEGANLYRLTRYENGSGESFLTEDNPEVIYMQGSYSAYVIQKGNGYEGSSYQMVQKPDGSWSYELVPYAIEFAEAYGVADELAVLFDEKDARYGAFFAKAYNAEWLVCRKFRTKISELTPERDPVTGNVLGVPASGAAGFNENASLRYAEVILNKAEALACLGDEQARSVMNDFLETRYHVLPALPAGKDELIRFIRQERYKELCFEGHRWFDLRRYAVNSVYAQKVEVTHVWNTRAGVGGSYTLKAYDSATPGCWILPLPKDVLNYCYPNMDNFDRLSGVVSHN